MIETQELETRKANQNEIKTTVQSLNMSDSDVNTKGLNGVDVHLITTGQS